MKKLKVKSKKAKVGSKHKKARKAAPIPRSKGATVISKRKAEPKVTYFKVAGLPITAYDALKEIERYLNPSKIDRHEGVLTSQPIILNCTNPHPYPIQIRLFGSAYNKFENEYVTTPASEAGYEFIQKNLFSHKYAIGITHFESTNIKFLRKLQLTLKYLNVNGNSTRQTFCVKPNKKSFDKTKTDTKHQFKLDAATELNFMLAANTTLKILFYPSAVINLRRSLAGLPAIQEYSAPKIIAGSVNNNAVYNFGHKINHKFGTVLQDKYNTVKDHVAVAFKKKKLSPQLAQKFIDIHQKIDSINNIPVDFYRNLIDVYTDLNHILIHFTPPSKFLMAA